MELVRGERTIRATKKSYEVLYKSRGFKPVEKEGNEDMRLKEQKGRIRVEDKKATEPVKELPAFDDMVKRDIKALLDEGGVEYDERATKKELYKLLDE